MRVRKVRVRKVGVRVRTLPSLKFSANSLTSTMFSAPRP